MHGDWGRKLEREAQAVPFELRQAFYLEVSILYLILCTPVVYLMALDTLYSVCEGSCEVLLLLGKHPQHVAHRVGSAAFAPTAVAGAGRKCGSAGARRALG